MRARIKATGEVYKVIGVNHNDPEHFPQDVFHLGNNKWYPSEELELLNEDTTDWQQVRIQAAIAAMQGLVSSHEARITAKSMADKTNSSPSEIIAMCAVSMADELIKELKSNVDAYAEGRRQTAINESAICNLIAELQKKGGQDK